MVRRSLSLTCIQSVGALLHHLVSGYWLLGPSLFEYHFIVSAGFFRAPLQALGLAFVVLDLEILFQVGAGLALPPFC
jgi:hypothetical protein